MYFVTLSYNLDDKLIMSICSDKIIRQWNLNNEVLSEYIPENTGMVTAEYNTDTTKILCCGNDNRIYELNRKRNKIIKKYVNKYDIQFAIYNVDCSRILSYGSYCINERDIVSNTIINSMLIKGEINTVKYSHNSKSFIVALKNGLIKEFYSDSFKIKNIINEDFEEIIDVCYSIDDTKILYNTNTCIREMNINNNKYNYNIAGMWSTVYYNYDCSEIFYVSRLSGDICHYDIKSEKIIRIYKGSADCFPTIIKISNKHNRFCATYHNFTTEYNNDIIKEWDTRTGEVLHSLSI